MNEKLLKKLMNEDPLDAAEHLALEQALEAGDESVFAQYFASQDHVEPSLAWRSGLNEQLRQIAPAPRRRVNWLILGGLTSAAAMACAAIVFFAGRGSDVAPSIDGSNLLVSETEVGNSDQAFLRNPSANSELGHILISAHQADTAQTSLGVRSPRYSARQVPARLDYENW